MDIATFVVFNLAALSAVAIVFPLIWQMKGLGGWFAANLAVIATAVASFAYLPRYSALLTAAVFVPFVLTPGVLNVIVNRRTLRGDNAGAARLSRWATALSPTSRNREQQQVLDALAEPTTDARVNAFDALARNVTDPEARLTFQLHGARIAADWPAIVRIADQQAKLPVVAAALAIRALGEVGRTEDMIRLYESLIKKLPPTDVSTARLFVMAFAGEPDAVARIVGGPLKALDPDMRHFWVTVARLRATADHASARRDLETLAASAQRPAVREAAQNHLDRNAFAAGPATLSSHAAKVVSDLAARLARNDAARARSWRDCPVTLALLAAIAAMFAISEWTGGSDNIRNLIRLGAIDADLVVAGGQYWRLIAGLFLHFGPLHLAANSLVLLIFGFGVEKRHGHMALAVAFLLGGALSSAMVCTLMQYDYVQYGVLVGASGAIFAVFGFEAVSGFINWRRTRNLADRSAMLILAAVLAIQVTIDLLIPEVSLAAHLSGFLAGALIGGIWHQLRPPPPSPGH